MRFYLSGKTLKEYSTLDISLIENNSGGVLSYFGITKVNGYRWLRSNDYAFDVETGSGKPSWMDSMQRLGVKQASILIEIQLEKERRNLQNQKPHLFAKLLL